MAESGSLTVYPGAYVHSESSIGSISNAAGPVGKGTSNNGGAVIRAVRNADSYIWWPFDLSSIPEKASIDSVSCSAAVMRPQSAATGSVQLASGTTLKGASVALTGVNTKAILEITNTGTWTRDELLSCRLKLSIYSSSSTGSNRDFTFYGADLTVQYTVDNEKFMLRIGSEENLLPEGYTQLEYIESTGQQYADLGFKPNTNTRVVMDCQADSTNSGGSFPFGVRASTSDRAFAVALMESQVFYNYGSNYKFADYPNTLERMTIDANAFAATFEGSTSVKISLSTVTFTCGSNLLVGTFGDNGTPSIGVNAWNGSIWSCQAYDNGTLIRDCYPCLNQNGVPGLYDIVNGVFYGSATSTPFVAGPEYNKVWHDVARVFKKVSGIWVEQEELANVIEDGVRYKNGGEIISPKKTVTITGSGHETSCYVEIGGSKYIEPTELQVDNGTTMLCHVYGSVMSITLDGVDVSSDSSSGMGKDYTHIINENCTVDLYNYASMAPERRITITTN